MEKMTIVPLIKVGPRGGGGGGGEGGGGGGGGCIHAFLCM